MQDTPGEPHFDVHPSVVFQLGEGLISDEVQALIELVKNCYDADARYAKVTIDTVGRVSVPGAKYPATGGRIIVEDDGVGMDEETIRRGWLIISNSMKRDLKAARKTTAKGRTPLGDKGLGRLGAQRLGQNVDIMTKTEGGEARRLSFSWSDFECAETLGSVAVELDSGRLGRKSGTTVVLSSLKDSSAWRGSEALQRLERELSRMISPYGDIRDFVVRIEIDGKSLDLVEVSEKVRELATVRYAFQFDGEVLSVRGQMRLDMCRPSKPEEASAFAELAEADGGKRFFESLAGDRRASRFGLTRAEGKKWFVEVHLAKAIEDLPGLERVATNGKGVANPGPFSGEVDGFDLGQEAHARQAVFNKVREFREYVRTLSGIRVYRDGFAIRVDQDWLGLGAQWTSAPSYYGLKPSSTLGYVALSARDNLVLQETTDREGFKATPHFRNFRSLLDEFLRFTGEAQEFVRRGWLEFLKAHRSQVARVEPRKTVEDISEEIQVVLKKAKDRRKALQGFGRRLDGQLSRSRELLKRPRAKARSEAAHRQSIETEAKALASLLEEAGAVVGQIGTYLEELEGLTDLGRVLDDRVDGLRRQMDDLYGTVALGLTAEALSHEIFHVADSLARRAKTAEARLAGRPEQDRAIVAFIESVNTAVMTLRKQMSYLSPALRYVREQKHVIDIMAFLGELELFYRERLQRAGIQLVVPQGRIGGFVVKLNKGKLAQIFDNLIVNSEYWLIEDMKAGRIKLGQISVEVESPSIRVADNGRGIDPSVEGALFEPFVSAKGRGIGRGLGLFIVKQLLDSEGCHVEVLPQRNAKGRLFCFQIDLRGALNA